MRDTIAGRFELLTPIAEGGSGAVWRAHDLRLGRECAAKVLRQRDSADLLRFVREQSVNLEHPHVVAPYGWAAEDEHVAIAMELVSGGTLEAALQDNGAVADWLAEELVCQLLEALRFVHTRGWVHRDVKPANVLLEPTGSELPVARLADFGIAVRLHDARLTHTGTVVGTPGYLPHEAYAPGSPSRAMDLYAAGVTAVRMVLPEADLSGDPLGPDDVARLGLFEGSPALRSGVAGLLSRTPQERIEAADELLGTLLAGAGARAGRSGETADREPFEVFDVLEPTTERELSPVADAARLPSAGGGQDAPIAWHAVHRQAIPNAAHPAMAERGQDPLRPFAPVTADHPRVDRADGGGSLVGSAALADPEGLPGPGNRTAPARQDAPGAAAPAGDATRTLEVGDSTERLDPSAVSLPGPLRPGPHTGRSATAPPSSSRSAPVHGDTRSHPERPGEITTPESPTTTTGRAGSPDLHRPSDEDLPPGERTVRLTATGDAGTAGSVMGSTADGGTSGNGGTTRRREPGRRGRARWPWWLAGLALAALALVAGYVWLGPLLANWSGGAVPGGPETAAPSGSAPGATPSEDDTTPAPEGTPVCTQLEDGTVSCVVTP